jgi:hypothetical protein
MDGLVAALSADAAPARGKAAVNSANDTAIRHPIMRVSTLSPRMIDDDNRSVSRQPITSARWGVEDELLPGGGGAAHDNASFGKTADRQWL